MNRRTHRFDTKKSIALQDTLSDKKVQYLYLLPGLDDLCNEESLHPIARNESPCVDDIFPKDKVSHATDSRHGLVEGINPVDRCNPAFWVPLENMREDSLILLGRERAGGIDKDSSGREPREAGIKQRALCPSMARWQIGLPVSVGFLVCEPDTPHSTAWWIEQDPVVAGV